MEMVQKMIDVIRKKSEVHRGIKMTVPSYQGSVHKNIYFSKYPELVFLFTNINLSHQEKLGYADYPEREKACIPCVVYKHRYFVV